METRRFGKKVKLPATIAIKHQIRKLMLQHAIEAERTENAKASSSQQKEMRRVSAL